MDSVFTLPYSEYKVAEELQKIFSKNKDYTVLIPVSRQQKGFDLIIYNCNSKKAVTIQIKASRAYDHARAKKGFDTTFWFGNIKYFKGRADFYILFAVYAEYSIKKILNKSRQTDKWIHNTMLVFSDKEMGRFLGNLKTKKGKTENQFYFSLNKQHPNRIYLTRGNVKIKDYKKYLFENKIHKIERKLK